MKLLERLGLIRKAPMPPTRPPVASIASPSGRPPWDVMGFGKYTPWFEVPATADLRIYEQLRELIPLVDTGVVQTGRLVGAPCIEAEPEVKEEVEAWMESLPVNRVQVGYPCFLSSFLSDLLTYGRAHAEIVLNNRRDDIAHIVCLHPRTMFARPMADGFHVEWVQKGTVSEPITFNPELLLTAVYDLRGDNPNGTSALFSLQMTGEAIAEMTKSVGQTWSRFGTPNYHLNWQPPEGWDDPQGTISQSIVSQFQSDLKTVIVNRAAGDIREFVSAGNVKLEVIGAAGEELEFAAPYRSLEEQIVAKSGLPPLLYGLSWSTTERMSTVQTALLAELVDDIQCILSPVVRHTIDLRMRLQGRVQEYDLGWDAANLMDEMQAAQADKERATATDLEIKNLLQMMRLGLKTPEDMARDLLPEMKGKDDEYIRGKLKDLITEAPPEPVPMAGQPGANGNGTGPNNNRPPQMVGRSLTYEGNGH